MRHSVSTTAEVLGLVVALFGTVLDGTVADPVVRSGCISWLREILNACIVVCPGILGGESSSWSSPSRSAMRVDLNQKRLVKSWIANVA